jgi:hypothetical protein
MLCVSIVVGAFLIRVHPLFYVIALIILVIYITISAALANVFYEITISEAFFTASADEFPNIQLVILRLPIWATIISFIIVIVLYWKGGGGGGGFS